MLVMQYINIYIIIMRYVIQWEIRPGNNCQNNWCQKQISVGLNNNMTQGRLV